MFTGEESGVGAAFGAAFFLSPQTIAFTTSEAVSQFTPCAVNELAAKQTANPNFAATMRRTMWLLRRDKGRKLGSKLRVLRAGF